MQHVVDFWRGKRVLVTGHTGFKGGWLVLWLQRLGAQVTGISLSPNTTPNLFNLIKIVLPFFFHFHRLLTKLLINNFQPFVDDLLRRQFSIIKRKFGEFYSLRLNLFLVVGALTSADYVPHVVLLEVLDASLHRIIVRCGHDQEVVAAP